MLRTFVAHLLRGKSVLIEGQTPEIFVSWWNVYEECMDKLLSGTSLNYSFPLEVTYVGECAQDMGSPHKEFLGAMMREIKLKLFTEKDGKTTYILRDYMVSVNRMHYSRAGIVFGMQTNLIMLGSQI